MGRKLIYDKDFHPHAVKLYRMNKWKDTEIAKDFGVTTKTIAKWRDTYPEFKEAYNHGRVKLLSNVISADLKIAFGYDYEEVHREIEKDDKGNVIKKKMKTITKHIPPNAAMLMFLTTNLDSAMTRNPRAIEEKSNDDESTIKLEEFSNEELIQRAANLRLLLENKEK